MSIAKPASSWALDMGEEHGLPQYALILLVVLADMANGKGYCWPMHSYLMTRARQSRRSVIRGLQILEAASLIRSEARGKGRTYYVLRPSTTGATLAPIDPQTCATQAHVDPHTGATQAPIGHEHVPDLHEHVPVGHSTCATQAHRTLKRTLKNQEAREARPGKAAEFSGVKEAAPPAAPMPVGTASGRLDLARLIRDGLVTNGADAMRLVREQRAREQQAREAVEPDGALTSRQRQQALDEAKATREALAVERPWERSRDRQLAALAGGEAGGGTGAARGAARGAALAQEPERTVEEQLRELGVPVPMPARRMPEVVA